MENYVIVNNEILMSYLTISVAVHESNQAECVDEAGTGLCVTLEEEQCDTVELKECVEVQEERCEEVECELVVERQCTERQDCGPAAQVSCVLPVFCLCSVCAICYRLSGSRLYCSE